MPAFKITYRHDGQAVFEETVFTKTLKAGFCRKVLLAKFQIQLCSERIKALPYG
ncbi:Uncharacterised protein [Photobacterium damselae]|uniref:Uncharacterized protein n=1 Tax=Photobacterium damselae TaxID=38293 RepID=A0A2X1XUZ9_PHODM|nr:Uncharacterised protein [Photobacterium damselae]